MMEAQDTKRNPSRSIISLKDIPPLDPSSIPRNSSLKPRTRMVPVNSEKQRYEVESEVEEDNVKSSFSNIQIDPNSTRSVNIEQEENIVPKQQEDTKPKPKVVTCGPEESMKRSAKSTLNEICTCKRWKPPVYECCKVEGPCHMRLFTYKVLVDVRDSSGTIVLECFGSPKSKKKDAAEHAAEAALWYLEHSSICSHRDLVK